MKVFISHSSEDAKLVKNFTDLLETGFHIDSSEIYCTTTHDNIGIGSNPVNDIRDNMLGSKVKFFLISESFTKRPSSMMELGASWALKDNIFPIIVPPLTHDFLKDTLLDPTWAVDINNKQGIYNIYNELIRKNMLERLEPKKELELSGYIEKFIEAANRFIYGSIEDVLESANPLLISENGNPDALKITNRDEEDKNIITMNCDFRPNSFYKEPSKFISYVLKFEPHISFIKPGTKSSLHFALRSEDESITNMVVEIKSGNNLYKAHEKDFAIQKKWTDYVIPLSPDTKYAHHLDKVSEICFVVRPNYTKENFGTLEIRNLQFKG